MADFEKIDRNLQRLFKAKAPDQHVDAYLQSEGVTPQQVSEWKNRPKNTYESYVKPVIDGAADVAQGAYTAVVGKHDPKFKGLPGIEGASGIIDPGAEMAAVSDAAYHDVYKKNLGDRYLGTETDANGYQVITFRGDDGQPQKAYVNRPGLDWQDVNRGISSAVPYMATAFGAGRLLKGAGTAANVIAQGLTASATSAGQDVAAQGMGSEQGIDQNRMLVAGALGAGGELVGRVAGPFIRKIIGDRSLVDANGKLTARGRKLAEKEGVDPNLIDGDLAKEIQRLQTNAADPAEVLVKAQNDRFGIPTTKGQRTNDPQMLLIEKDIRAGTLGDRAKEALRNVDGEQEFAIKRGATMYSPTSIPSAIAPNRGASDIGRAALGDGAKEGFEAASRKVKALENAAWKGTENIAPRSGALERLPKFVQKELGPRLVDDEVTPVANAMGKQIDAYIKGSAEMRPGAAEVFGQQSVTYIDQMRRRLMAMKNGAAPGGEDAAAAKAIYVAFDKWIGDAAENQLLTGSPGAAQALLNARRTTAELRGILSPRLNGKKTPAARILEKVKDADTGEEVLKALLGSSGPKAEVATGGVTAMKHFKAAVTQLGGREGRAAWNDVRLAYWLKIVRSKNGEILPKGTLVNSIMETMKNRQSLMRVMYSEKERKLMLQFAQAIKSATPKDPNPPGSGTAIRGLFPNLVKDQLRAEQARNTFGAKGQRHKILMARIYRALGKVLPNVLDGKNQFGSMAANRVTNQNVTKMKGPSLGGYSAALSPAGTDNRVGRFSPNHMLK